jgi:hypothetical protein
MSAHVVRWFVQSIARTSNGSCELIAENSKASRALVSDSYSAALIVSQIASQVTAQLQRALQPAISNITVDWGQAYQEKASPHMVTLQMRSNESVFGCYCIRGNLVKTTRKRKVVFILFLFVRLFSISKLEQIK